MAGLEAWAAGGALLVSLATIVYQAGKRGARQDATAADLPTLEAKVDAHAADDKAIHARMDQTLSAMSVTLAKVETDVTWIKQQVAAQGKAPR